MSDYNDGILLRPCLRMDTHFGDEYESIEFGDGTGYIKAAPILAKVGALHEEIDRLRDESAELRKLVRGLWYCTENENKAMCEGCPLGTVEGDRLALACEKLMYELGVEVDA